LKIVGTGPLENEVKEAAALTKNIEWLGIKNGAEVQQLMSEAKATVCPSLWYEGMPRVVIESLAVGTPVVASNIGCYPEMIDDNESGILFPTGDAGALRARIRKSTRMNSFVGMRPAARRCFEAEYTGEKNLSLLLNVYRDVLYAGSMVLSTPAPART
jgi:glycosyltransferase involved in cell wall biosynthesis